MDWVVICCWCLKNWHCGRGDWKPVIREVLLFVADEDNAENVSHGLCPPCFKRETTEADLAEKREALEKLKRSAITGEMIESSGL